MRKVTLACLLLSVTLMACTGLFNQCVRCGFVGGRTYNLSYPIGQNTQNERVATADSDGCVYFTKPSNSGCDAVVVYGIGVIRRVFFAAPSSIDLQAPPTSVTITGEAMSTAYGMPVVELRDSYGNLIDQRPAEEVGADGTWLRSTMPDLSTAYSGHCSLRVSNITWDGYKEEIGVADMDTYGRDCPDSDGDGWCDQEDCAPYDPNLNSDCNGGGDPGPGPCWGYEGMGNGC